MLNFPLRHVIGKMDTSRLFGFQVDSHGLVLGKPAPNAHINDILRQIVILHAHFEWVSAWIPTLEARDNSAIAVYSGDNCGFGNDFFYVSVR